MIVTKQNYVFLMKERCEEALEFFISNDGWIVKSIIYKSPAIPEEDKKECLNDAFFAIWRNVEKYDEKRAAFTTWIAGVTRYCLLNFLKKRNRLEYVSIEDIEMFGDYEQASDVYPSDIEAQIYEFRKLLLLLPYRDREIFMKLFWEEKDYDEVSRETGIEKEVLYNRVSRGKARIRKSLEERRCQSE